MLKRITFATGLAVGYVLGTRAGRERYEQLVKLARRVTENPTVQETAGVVGAQVGNAGKAVYDKVGDRLPVTSVKDFLARPTPAERAEMRRAGEPAETRTGDPA
ncbi:hypothetical protein CLV63_12099 [Murinocardiopsis flavida]|uniref:Oxygen-dependent protoporphyrinogen oxidase n=1 Tax=Murinocardiopsis flavida TaxID=645275 RepID=A0A2P8D2B8_9ACTN|nr:hypothetical protein [Murinocardiopsis flavida]PSK91373.1 hypothetical protein CLV63_12099 [Murinocardiopsis flavida]